MITALLEVAQTDLVEEVVTVSGQFKQNLYGLIEKILKNRGNILWALFSILIIILLARLALKIVSSVTTKVMQNEKYQNNTPVAKRTRTLMTLFRSVARYAIYFFVFLLAPKAL